jgi:hypothetical protein
VGARIEWRVTLGHYCLMLESKEMPSVLRVGGLHVPADRAQTLVAQYVVPQPGSPTGIVYDRLETGTSPSELGGADWLAPNLLNAPVKLKEFAVLTSVHEPMEHALRRVPPDLDLMTADDRDLEPLRALFAVLDELKSRRAGIGAVIFSKVLHRKRPGSIPIIDVNVLSCYQDHPTRADSPIPYVRDRTWSDFVVLLAQAMRDDLHSAPDVWTQLALRANPPLTRLRALDIVAWRIGNHPRRPGEEEL